ncbi:MAG TPA: hypothetical protein VK425_09095, partial [Acidimicrobiales bacterium]|nr:hypothetical protein [Acidimicrobiales bacterium]
AGNTLVVGADDAYSSGPGEVFVFTGGPGGWHQGALLQSPDPSEGSFGQVVAVSGGVIVVGAPWYGCPPGAATSLVCEGRTYVYGYGTSPSGSSSGSSGTSPGGPPGPPAGGPAGGSSGGTGSGSVRFSTVGHYLLPSPLGKAMCHAQRFDDGSVQAQIAVYGATCTEATSVLGPGADEAKGASYRSAGFSCEATAEGAGSEWASAWAGTYYAYSCADGAAQAAFNWGTGYLR